MFDTLLIITLFVLASLLVCLLTLRLNIDVKHLCLFFHSLPMLTDFLKFRPPLLLQLFNCFCSDVDINFFQKTDGILHCKKLNSKCEYSVVFPLIFFFVN